MNDKEQSSSLVESLRRFVPIGQHHLRHATVYGLHAVSSTAAYDGLLKNREHARESEIPLRYDSDHRLSIRSLLAILRMFGRVYRLACICRVCTFTVVSPADIFPAFCAVVAARLAGSRIVLNDYLFCDNGPKPLLTKLRLLADRISTPDPLCFPESIRLAVPVDRKLSTFDKGRYAEFRKDRAVPRIIAYGDFDDGQTLSLAIRALELIKQKYPRAEFYLPLFADIAVPSLSGSNRHALNIVRIGSENDLQNLFAETDILTCLSVGGFNSVLESRASAAGIPAIRFGAKTTDSAAITVPPGSYSALADAVIKLTDDDTYYRSYAAK